MSQFDTISIKSKRNSDENSRIGPKVFKLLLHPKTFNPDDFLINPKENPELNIGDIVEIFQPDGEGCHLLLQVTSFNDDVKAAISVENSIAAAFNLRTYTHVYMKVIEDPSTVCLDSVEITFKDQYMGRSEMWRVRNWLTNTCVYINKKLDYCDNSIRCQIYEMWAKGTRVACGVISENTKIVFRSSTSNLYLMIQMSSEMWDFDIHGDLYFEKAINGFLADLFNKWKKLGSNHDVTIVLFSRTFYEASRIEDFPEAMRLCLREDHKGRIYEDFYRVAVQNDRFDDWNAVLSQLRAMFTNYQKMVLNNYDHLGPGIPKAYNSTAAQGNYLEVLNMSLNIFEKHFLDRTFDRTGQLSVVISPGVGIFEVDRELTNITMQRIIDSGVGSDLVCVGEQPLHAVPLLKFNSKHSCYLSVDDFSMPHWINLSFYTTNKKVAYSTFVPRIKLPPLELHQKYRDNMIPIQFTQFNYQMEYVHNSLFDYDEYDSQIFSSEHPPHSQYIPTSPTLMDRDMSLASPRIHKLKERKLSSPDVHHSSAFDDNSGNSCGNQCVAMDDMIKEDHRIVRRHRWSQTQRLATRTLINPFDPAHVTVKLTSSRRRWTHIFPRGPSGLLVQQHHHNIELDSVDERETDESIGDCRSSDGERSSLSGSVVMGMANIGLTPKKKNTALLWGATGEQEWTPALTTGVDWKSLTIPACLPITTDFFPEESALQNDYVFSVYTLLPEDINMDFSVIRGSYKQPLTARDVFQELVSQRLSQGFQAIITTKKQTPIIDDDKNRSISTPLKKKVVSNERQAEQLLSIGRIFHRITMNESSITVTRYRPRHLYTPKSVNYKYRFRNPFTNGYEDEYVHFSTERLENFNWNYLDQYVCARGHTDYPLTENMKYWRYRMFLLPPKDDVVTKKICEQNLGICDIYSRDTMVLSKKQCIDDFLKFLEVHLNRVKRAQKKQKATSVSSPLRERTGSTRYSEKIRPRSESVKVGEKTKIFSSPLSESHSGTINAQMLDYHSEESEDAFASESLKLKQNATLPEIFELFTHPLHGVPFLQPAPTLPSCTFTSFDAINWISSHMEANNDPVKTLTAMRDARMICHASGDFRKPIIVGFHLYFILQQQDSKTQDFMGPLGNLKLFENEWMEVEIVDSIEKAQSFPNTGDKKPLQVYKECYLDVDIGNKSDRAEWGHAKYHKVMTPGVAYEIAVEWIAASGSIMNDLTYGWTRKALHCNFQLIPVPFDPVAEQLMEKLNPFRSPIFVPLNFDGIDNPPTELGEFESTFLEQIATRFGFIPTVAAPQTKLFVHCTGFMCILLPPFNKTYTTVDNEKEFHSKNCLGFLWAFNHMIQNKKWKVCSINDSDELFPHRMLKDFKNFCSNQNDRLARIWTENNTNNR